TDRTRPFRFKIYATGSDVEVQSSEDDGWKSAKVIERWESLHHSRLDGRSSAYDEWFGPKRIRAMVAGRWLGQWKNDLAETGPETLVLQAAHEDQITGTWSGDV